MFTIVSYPEGAEVIRLTFGAVLGAAVLAATATAASSYARFSSPTSAAAKLTTAATRVEKIHLFHPCAPVNPYLIRCGGYISGLKPLTASGKVRVRIDWRKVNPYMLEKTVYALGGVFQHQFVDTKVAY